MSFEFEEHRLATPPIKCDQEAVTTFWGIYKWPYKQYNRYPQLAGLELKADETRTMTKALRYISNATELGISIDGGLGFLAGPDVNPRVADRVEALTVFGDSGSVPEQQSKPPSVVSETQPHNSPPVCSPEDDPLHQSFERMLKEAGYHGKRLEVAVKLMMESEGIPAAHATTIKVSNGFIEAVRRDLAEIEAGDPGTFADWVNDFEVVEGTAEVIGQFGVALRPTNDPRQTKSKSKAADYLLKPNSLTTAQKEMLLEVEWAQRAFMQSYVIAIIESPLTFKNITALNIARLPSGQIISLRRADFWKALRNVKKLSLGVIPDWREVSKHPTGWVHDRRVQPSGAVTSVYQLLKEQISRQEKIKTLHFEWLCGGEYAPGVFSRNQHVLAAPLVLQSMEMVSSRQGHSISVLTLPYVESLSLKNCWLSPDILWKFLALKENSENSFQNLKFDSVSLSAPIPLNANLGLGVTVVNAGAVQQAQHAQAQRPAAQNQHPHALPQYPLVNHLPVHKGLEWLQVRYGSWSQIINEFTPGTSLADISYERGIGPKPSSSLPTELKKMEFRSCGYVRMTLDFDQAMLGIPGSGRPDTAYKSVMMSSDDNSLATIINHISAIEIKTLENAWKMQTSWNISRTDLFLDAKQDGVHNAGRGRFDGVIEPPKEDQLLISSQYQNTTARDKTPDLIDFN
jgi:hypothetical protein